MATKKIVSSLAEYKNGQLTCIVCRVPVKNELYWTGHINGRQHRDSINLLKRKAESEKESPGGVTKKSKIDNGDNSTFVKPKPPSSSTVVQPVPKDVKDRIIFKGTTSSTTSKPLTPPEKGSSVIVKKTNKPIVQFDDGNKEEEVTQDPKIESKTEPTNPSESPRKGMPPKSDIPEGFFDDPKQDAKARGKEYVDPEEAEWSKFLKEIASEEIQSESLLVVDEEESRKDRELDEIEDMMGHWQRVIDLEKKKDTRVKKMDTDNGDNDSDEDDMEFNEELDWRVKKF